MFGFCDEVLETYEEKLDEIKNQIKTLFTVQARLEKQIDDIKKQRLNMINIGN